MCDIQESFTNFPNNSTPKDVLLWLCFNDLKLKELPKIRKYIQNTLKGQTNIEQMVTDGFLLSATETLSNLIQHPIEKPSYIGLSLYTEIKDSHEILILDISDNAKAIPEFDAKCNSSYCKVQEEILEDGNGRGMGIISTIMDSFTYHDAQNSTDNLNHIIIGKRIEKTVKEPIATNNLNNESKNKEFTIFIVDDDPILRKLIDNILSKHYNTQVFTSAFEVLDAFEKSPPDLILSDLLMPEMNGAELRQALSKKENGDITPFVFLSGHPEEAGKDYVNRLGIDGFLNKSIKKEKLLETLERTLYRSKQIQNNISGKISDSISSALEPNIPESINNWSFSIKHAIAEIGGGDFILHHKTKNGVLLIFADVMGHGLPAKFFSYAYVGYLRGLINLYLKEELQPDILLNLMSKNIYDDDFLDNCIFTCQVIHLKESGELTIASAGHPWPILSTKKLTNTFEISGPLLGMMPNTHYSTTEYKMQKGERLILYTDGIFENISKTDHKKGQKILQNNIQQCSTIKNIQEMTEQLWNKQSEQFKKPFIDDATLLTIEYTSNK